LLKNKTSAPTLSLLQKTNVKKQVMWSWSHH